MRQKTIFTVKASFAVLMVIFLSFSALYVYVISQDIPFSSQIFFLNWNPPPRQITIPILLSYPDTDVATIGSNTSYCSVNFLLGFNGTLAENTSITIVNASCIYAPNQDASISVRFPEAVTESMRKTFAMDTAILGTTSIGVVEFQNREENNTADIIIRQIKPTTQTDFSFPVTGDYSPTLYISGQQEVSYTYNEVKIHVSPESEIAAQKIGKINLGLSYILVWLGLIGAAWLLFDLRKDDDEKQVFNISINMAPEINKTSPKMSNPNPKALPEVQPYSEGNGKLNPNKNDTIIRDNPNTSNPPPK